MKFEIKGNAKDPYIVDTEELTCTCPRWKFHCRHFTKENEGRLCKHLEKVLCDHPELKPVWMMKADQIESSGLPDPDGKVRYPRSIFDMYVVDLKSLLIRFDNIIEKYEFCGSYRRMAERVSDLDILLVLREGQDPSALFDYCEQFLGYIKLWRGDKKASYKVDGFIQVDFKIVPKESWAFAIAHYTGPKSHNIMLRQRASSLGYSLSEYGLKDKEGNIHTFEIKTEEGIYDFLKLPFVQPWNRT
jgi:DNA polymerase (family 10)